MSAIIAKKVAGVILVTLMIGGCSSPSLGQALTVYHVGFDVDTITGFHESEFPKYGCKGKINERVFLSILGSKIKNVNYRSDDVKSMVVSPESGSYYIDFYGTVRHGVEYFRINKNKFEKNIVYVGKC